MKTIQLEPIEHPDFVPDIYRQALDRYVLAVAKTRVEGTWKCYIGAVPGQNHDLEEAAVLHHGTQLPEKIARQIFGHLENIPYAR